MIDLAIVVILLLVIAFVVWKMRENLVNLENEEVPYTSGATMRFLGQEFSSTDQDDTPPPSTYQPLPDMIKNY